MVRSYDRGNVLIEKENELKEPDVGIAQNFSDKTSTTLNSTAL